MAGKKPSRREALRQFSRDTVASMPSSSEPLLADGEAIERQMDAAYKEYQRRKAVVELETLRASGVRLH